MHILITDMLSIVGLHVNTLPVALLSRSEVGVGVQQLVAHHEEADILLLGYPPTTQLFVRRQRCEHLRRMHMAVQQVEGSKLTG